MKRGLVASRPSRWHRLRLAGLMTCVAFFAGGCAFSNDDVNALPDVSTVETTYGAAETLCTVSDSRLTRVSGAVRRGTNNYSLVNARGARVFNLDSACRVRGTVRLGDQAVTAVKNMATSPDGIAWLADVGGEARAEVAFIGLDVDGGTRRVVLAYPDGAHIARSALVGADNSAIVVTSDPGGASTVYAALLPAPGVSRGELRLVGAVTGAPTAGSAVSPVLRGGAISPDGLHVAIRTPTSILEWDIPSPDVAESLATQQPRTVAQLNEPTVGAVAYSDDGARLMAFSRQPGPVVGFPISRRTSVGPSDNATAPRWAWVTIAGVLLFLCLVIAAARQGRPAAGVTHRRRRLAAFAPGWSLAGLATLLAVWGATLLVLPAVQPTYVSTAVVGFVPRDPVGTGADTVSLLVPRYLAVLDSSATLRSLGVQIGESERYLRDHLDALIEPGTANLEIRVTTSDPVRSARIANSLAAVVLHGAASDDLLFAQRAAGAVPAQLPRAPTANDVLWSGLLAGPVAAGLVGIAFARRSRRRQRIGEEPQ